LTLSHDQNLFSFQFAVLSFLDPARNQYRYMLEGLDDSWNPVDASHRLATFTTLPAGDYMLRVQGSNNRGVWNEQGTALRLRILPPWWATWRFRGLCASIFLALLWAGYQARVQQLKRGFKQLREVVETIPAMAWTARPDGTNEFVNKRWAEFTGLSAEDTASSGWMAAVHPEDRQILLDKWRASLNSGQPLEFEVRMRSATTGEYRWLLAHGVPMRDASGKIVRWHGILTDIQDRKQAEEERERRRQLETDLAHLSRVSMMGELTASIAHEVNQPLTGIVSNGSACLRWLAGDSPNVSEVREAVRDIVRDGKRAGEVIARIRALSRRTPMPTEKLNLNDTIREVLVLVEDKTRKNGVRIQTHFAGDLSPVSGDRVQLQQVVLNLVMNGIEAMSGVDQQARELLITTANIDANHVVVTVRDSGPGLDPNAIRKIFEPFYTTKGAGMGMGLSICRSILQNHGGRLWASANDGPGATFQFSVPKHREEGAHA
jgi:PAS domain S-box-containing protein